MKNVILLMLCCFVFVSPLYAAKDTGDKKAAVAAAAEQKKTTAWYKKLVDCEKKALAALKKVKEEKHFKRAARELARARKNMPDYGQTARSWYRRMRDSLTEPQKEIIRKNAEELVDLNDALQGEMVRVDEIDELRGFTEDDQIEEAIRTTRRNAFEIIDMIETLLDVCEAGPPEEEDEEEEDEEEEDEDAPNAPQPVHESVGPAAEVDDEDAAPYVNNDVKKKGRWKKVKTDD
ncbi:MAG: hypothetical protein J6R92_02675 [Akkermansia sp.]|nr:hypothetical protein [Akkermansia sp.]